MKNYELMLLLKSSLSSQDQEKLGDQIKQIFNKYAKGEITKVDRWGKRSLAYEIDKQTDGVYEVWNLTAEPSGMKEFEGRLRREEGLLRFMLTSK